MTHIDCVIIGGGAAGLMCAATAAQRGKRVAVLEHANKLGKKILMSGGGRCNFTNLDVTPANFLSANPHFCKSALSRYTQWDFIALVEKHGLAYHEKTLGQLFCDNKAKELLAILLQECQSAGVALHKRCSVHAIDAQKDDAGYQLDTDIGLISCDSLVIATGGLSIPTLGATGFGYDVAEQFGLRVTRRDAALVPYTFIRRWRELASSLAGVSMPVTAECNGQTFAEAMLFTHKGISGPAVLQISNYWQPGDAVTIDLLPDSDLAAELPMQRKNGSKMGLLRYLNDRLPKRFTRTWLAHYNMQAILDKPLAELSNDDISRLADKFHYWQCIPAGTEGYRIAEVTRGGVDTDAISSKTFEAKQQPGLFFIGEVLDVTGWLGGYNFQWAWASGYCAGQYV